MSDLGAQHRRIEQCGAARPEELGGAAALVLSFGLWTAGGEAGFTGTGYDPTGTVTRDGAAVPTPVGGDLRALLLAAGLASMDMETMMETWMPAGLPGMEQLQKMFWDFAAGKAGKKGGER